MSYQINVVESAGSLQEANDDDVLLPVSMTPPSTTSKTNGSSSTTTDTNVSVHSKRHRRRRQVVALNSRRTILFSPWMFSLLLTSMVLNIILLHYAGEHLIFRKWDDKNSEFSTSREKDYDDEEPAIFFHKDNYKERKNHNNLHQQRLLQLEQNYEYNLKMEQYHAIQNNDIRNWGCHLTTIPFIFVHIGKAGGGSARARIAASSFNFTSTNKDNWKEDLGSYYPIRDKSTNTEGKLIHKAKFCSSKHFQFRPLPEKSFESTLVCNASTPIGMALACPSPIGKLDSSQAGRNCVPDMASNVAPIVYTGHNFLGSEYHWLPPRFLEQWWEQHWSPPTITESSSSNNKNKSNNNKLRERIKTKRQQDELQQEDTVVKRWRTLMPEESWDNKRYNFYNKDLLWCNDLPRPFKRKFHLKVCQKHMYYDIDKEATKLVLHKLTSNSTATTRKVKKKSNRKQNKYISRTRSKLNQTMNTTSVIVQPVNSNKEKITTSSVSSLKYRKSHNEDSHDNHDNDEDDSDSIPPIWGMVHASLPVLRVTQVREPFSWIMSKFYWHNVDYNYTCDDIKTAIGNPNVHPAHLSNTQPGWLRRMSLLYIYYLCGEDCMVRHYSGESTLEELEKQAAYNLRHSFTVVGLSNETQQFYNMLNTRIDYLNTTLNPHIKGDRHSSTSAYDQNEQERCKNVYLKNKEFQKSLLVASPEFAIISRLYHVGLHVNRYQTNELHQCSSSSSFNFLTQR